MSSIQKSYLDPNKIFDDPLLFMEEKAAEFLQALFNQFEPGSEFHYDPDHPESCGVSIEGVHTDNLKDVDTRPKIVVGRGPVVWENRGINNFVGSRNLSRESQGFTDILNGTLGVSCFARELRVADKLGNIVFQAFKQFKEELRTQGALSVMTAQVGGRAKVKSDARPELFVVPVMIRLQITQNWKKTKAAPVKLNKVDTEVKIQTSVNGVPQDC